MSIQAPRGTKDITPNNVWRWNNIERNIRDICGRFGYKEIRTPIFEHTELFHRGIGETTDVVEKEMYTFEDRSGRSITLRPENTAAVVRSYLENKLYADSQLNKLFYIGSMFRYDRPQAGRYREFHQFGVEAIGEKNPEIDAEVILLAIRFLESLGLKNLELSINSVGCPKCRKKYRDILQDFFKDKKDKLCEDCSSRYDRNPMRILDCKKEKCRELSVGVPEITDCLCEECESHFTRLKALLTSLNINFKQDCRLVRGLDYYTKTAFEIKYPPLGAQSAVVGGGRYDGLVEEIGGNATPAVGFAIGLERVLLALEKQDLMQENVEAVDVFIVALGEAASQEAFKLLNDLRDAGFSALMDFSGRSMKAQLKQADKNNAAHVLIIGDDEIKEDVVVLRDMKASEQKKVSRKEIINILCAEVKR